MSKLDHIIEYISERNFIHTRKLKKSLLTIGPDYDERAEAFFTKYENLLVREGKSLDYAIDSYLRFLADITAETIRFRETGNYTATSFDEVNRLVYENPDVMVYHMHALLLSQFLWKHHYEMFCFFSEEIAKQEPAVSRYLEIGGGHGLQLAEAIRILKPDTQFKLVDISPTSLDIARRMVESDRLEFILSDIFRYEPGFKFDFITMGEVLEHVEDPLSLLCRVSDLLTEDGTLFITTPTNAPTIDHIYLFRNAGEIRELIHKAGLTIASEFSRYAENVTPEFAEEHKITLHYGASLKKSPTTNIP